MATGSTYMYKLNSALNAFTALSRAEILLLQKLSENESPMTYNLLYDTLALECAQLGKQQFIAGLRRLETMGSISRKITGRYVLFSITLAGKLLLAQFNAQFESIVRDHCKKYNIDPNQ